MKTKNYTGIRDCNGVLEVFGSDGRPLPRRLDLFNHSPTGFECGYGGSGPSQLALALLADFTGDDELAVRMHQQFKWKVVSAIPNDRQNWVLKGDEIQTFLDNNAQD